MKVDLAIIGGGPAGLSAAITAKNNGVETILVIEREPSLGGILQQCIHNGFGLEYFKEELTGPEYAERFMRQLLASGIHFLTETMVYEITGEKVVKAVNKTQGLMLIHAKSIILAMGCREKPRGSIALPGSRPAGVMTAGTAQRYINIEGYHVGKKILILGSGDIGLIMARRLFLEGAEVIAVAEILPYSGGLARNIVQCLHDYDIPLLLSHTVTDLSGKDRVEEVTLSQVDCDLRPIKGTERKYACDTLLLSVGLVPENELSKLAGVQIDLETGGPIVTADLETSVPGVFACGNVLHVHDIVDHVTLEAQQAGTSASRYLQGLLIRDSATLSFKASKKTQYSSSKDEMICILCPVGCSLSVKPVGDEITVTGNKCPKGREYAVSELTSPKRTLTSTVILQHADLSRLPVKTDKPLKKELVLEAMSIINQTIVSSPIKSGDIIISGILGTDVNIVSTRSIP